MSTKEGSIGLAPPSWFYMSEPFIGMKKFATLLTNNGLAETPQALALMRLGRQSAVWERISEINLELFLICLQILEKSFKWADKSYFFRKLGLCLFFLYWIILYNEIKRMATKEKGGESV
ncbi:hypothetical protein [Peribacillus simplex]|uniref:hypothetical protein n=1 Tax=Peribacillus simplex TaxID=1478 RepID=UPI002E1CBB2F|nr:hypothetical protein [Peribacillus simplex]